MLIRQAVKPTLTETDMTYGEMVFDYALLFDGMAAKDKRAIYKMTRHGGGNMTVGAALISFKKREGV